jgi:hypothetical protein
MLVNEKGSKPECEMHDKSIPQTHSKHRQSLPSHVGCIEQACVSQPANVQAQPTGLPVDSIGADYTAPQKYAVAFRQPHKPSDRSVDRHVADRLGVAQSADRQGDLTDVGNQQSAANMVGMAFQQLRPTAYLVQTMPQQ